MTYSIDDFFIFDKAIPLEQFLEELDGMAGAFANDEDVETDKEISAGNGDWSFCYFTEKKSREDSNYNAVTFAVTPTQAI